MEREKGVRGPTEMIRTVLLTWQVHTHDVGQMSR